MEKENKNTYICPDCKCEWSNLVKYCRKCELKIRKAKFRAKYSKK